MKTPKRTRPKSEKNYRPAPLGPGAYWVKHKDNAEAPGCGALATVWDQPDKELRPDGNPGASKLWAVIYGAGFTERRLVAAWIAEGWTRWAERKPKSQPGPRWREFVLQAQKRIGKANGFSVNRTAAEQIAADIIATGEGEAFLKSVRRGRATQRQNLRWQILREVELKMGDAVPRRRKDSNTPDALAQRAPMTLTLSSD